jgi:hypothetical protein
VDARGVSECCAAGVAAGSPGPRCFPFTIMTEAAASSDHVARRGRNSKVKRASPSGPRMPCGGRCGARLTASRIPKHSRRLPRMPCGWPPAPNLPGANMRAHFTMCAKRPTASDDVDRRGRSLKLKRGRPPLLQDQPDKLPRSSRNSTRLLEALPPSCRDAVITATSYCLVFTSLRSPRLCSTG